ncbi:MAG: CPBP family intramembrane metalloprotease [Culturomica sp.]|jgi:membrane protease YdiL (CAAX protease family)|nr:CPBP family intramembrane metalloprotease [Culturomica sp.]
MNFSKKDCLVIFLYIALIAVQFYGLDLLHLSETGLQTMRLVIILLNAFIVLYAYKGVLSADWKDFRQRKWTKWLIIAGSFIVVTCLISLIRNMIGHHEIEAAALEATASSGETNAIKSLSSYAFTLSLIALFIPLLSSVTEEIMFRYVFMFKHSKFKVLQYTMLLLSSVAFGLIHYLARGSVAATIPYIFAGLLFGSLYLWKKNIWYNIFTHMLFNGINMVMALFGTLFQRFAG